MFDAAQWQQLLDTTLVRSIDYHEVLESTNVRALSQLDHPIEDLPRLVITPRQTRGRGRQGNSWWSADGALTFSLIIDVASWEFAAHRVPQIALWTGLGIRDALSEFVPNQTIQLKWPNDVYLDRRKVCGILVEGATRFPGRVVVGIGINVNNRIPRNEPETASAVGDWSSRATSVRDATGTSACLLQVLIRVLQCVTEAWQIGAARQTPLPDVWNAHCMLTGRIVVCHAGTAVYRGICHGVDEHGYLLIAAEDHMHRCVGGTISDVEGLW